MRKSYFLAAATIMLIIVMTACSSKSEYKRNENYEYGTLVDRNIEEVYELVGFPEKTYMTDYSDGVSYGSKGSYLIYVSETKSGGIVAYTEDDYVYSSDKNEKNNVRNALIKECMNSEE